MSDKKKNNLTIMLMKSFILTVFSITSIFVFGQSWSPIRTNEKMNYKHSDSTYISNTIWVDSAFSVENDSIFYLNRIVKNVPGNPEIALRNQAQFFTKFFTKQEYGIYTFGEPDYYMFLTTGGIGSSWSFTGTINAEVSDIVFENIMGMMDSVKVISLSDGNVILLSKNFGIIKFPDFENGGYYEFVGIQGTEPGETIPGFWDIYDFDVGDVFQYNENSWFMATNFQVTRKITITDKTINGNILTYNVDGIYSAFIMDWGGPSSGWEAYPYTEEIQFVDSIGHLANKYINDLAVLPNSESLTGSGKVFAKTLISFDETLNTISKKFGIKFYPEYSGNLYYDLDEDSDTLYKYSDLTIIDPPCSYKGLVFSYLLGNTYHAEGCFEYDITKYLEGYITNGDTIGTITTDSTLLTVSIEDNFSSTETFKVYPNPASDVLNISLPGVAFGINATIELRDVQGILIFRKGLTNKEETIDVSELKRGVYLYSILQNGTFLQRGKVLIK